MEDRGIAFLEPIFSGPANIKDRPRVILTYAQSLDGTIGQKEDASGAHLPLAISCQESMVMTHALRACCDGILVGVGTIIADNPRLSIRLVAKEKAHSIVSPFLEWEDVPRPVILDTNLRTPLHSKILARNPIIFCSTKASGTSEAALALKGATIRRVNADGRISFDAVFKILLSEFHLRTLMVEGGSSIIRALLKQPHLLDSLVVTIAPVIFSGGVKAYEEGDDFSRGPLKLKNTRYTQFGCDTVMAGSIENVID
ncbi:dihydrofolate reductase-like domain-containing protein [Chytridium lagenaria]|nr:dihydrofolate reductase-like domain-containing protein [Chytridium lagenaria]